MVSIASDRAAHQDQLAQFNAEARFQRFINDETDGLVEFQRSVVPGSAGAFQAHWEFGEDAESGFDARARAFMESVPEHLRPAFDARMVSLAGNLRSTAADFGIAEQVRFTGLQLDETLNNTILPRIASAAALPDDAQRQEALNQIIADGEALINASPYLTPIQKDAAINGTGDSSGWRARAQTAFNNALPPEDRGAFLGVPIDPEAALAFIGARAGSGVRLEGVDPDFAFRLATAIEAAERATGATAQINSAARTPEEQAQLYANYIQAPYVFDDVTYVPNGVVGLAAEPGTSRHERGAAADIQSGQVLAWLHEHAAEYGLEFLTGDAFRDDPGHIQLSGSGALPAPRLGDIPYEQRNALAADAARETAAAANARIAAQNAESAWRVNDLLVGIHDGRYGAAAVQQARQAGWLTDIDDINKVDAAMESAYGEIIDTQAALGLMGDTNYTFNPFNTEDRDAVDLAFEAMGGVGALLSTDEAAGPEREQAVARTMAVVRRTGIVPEAAMDALLGGMFSSNPAIMASAFTVLDAIYRENPQALLGPNGLNEEQLLRYQTWQTLSPLMSPEQLVERMRPDLDPREVERRDRLLTEGRELAAERSDEDIIDNLVGGFFGAGVTDIPTGTQLLALRDDYQTLFAERYALTGNAETAHTQAVEALRQKWGVTDAGNTRRVMAYPPEQQFQPVANSGADGYQWMRDAIRTFVETEIGPNPQAYWLVATDRTEAALGTGDPPYQVVAVDAQGMVHVLTAGGLNADREAARAAAREQFAVDRAAAQAEDAGLPVEMIGPDGEVVRYIGDDALRDLGVTQPAAPGAAPTAQPATAAPPVAGSQRSFSTTPGVNMETDRLWRLSHPQPAPVPSQEGVPEGQVRLLGGAIVPIAEGAKDLAARVKERLNLQRDEPVARRREPKDEAAAMTQRALAARKRMLALQAATQARVPQTAPPATVSSPASPGASPTIPAAPPAIRRARANGIRSGASEVPMDSTSMPQVIPPLLPRVPGQIRPENVAGYARPTTAPVIPVERADLAALPPEPSAMPGVYPLRDPNASQALRNRDVMRMTLQELDWFLNNADPTPDELRQMGARLTLLQEQAEVNTIVAGAR